MRRLLLILITLLTLTGCASKTAPVEKPSREIAMADTRVKVKQRPLIVIDAGHGGKDHGAKCPDPQTEEKVLNLQTALILNQYLQRMGFQTILTRGEDFFVPLNVRAGFANSNRASLFVSVHYNSAPNKKAEGVEVFFYDAEDDPIRTGESKVLAKKVLDRIVTKTATKSRGVKNANLAVIRETKMPAILVEGGFMTNEKELSRLRDPAHLQNVAESIALGVRDYYKG